MAHDHRQLWRDLKRENAILRGQLEAAGIVAVDTGVHLPELTGQQSMILGVLLNAHPKAVDVYKIDAEVPPITPDRERDINSIKTQVCHIRAALGPESIETVWGVGYRLSDATAAMLRGPPQNQIGTAA